MVSSAKPAPGPGCGNERQPIHQVVQHTGSPTAFVGDQGALPGVADEGIAFGHQRIPRVDRVLLGRIDHHVGTHPGRQFPSRRGGLGRDHHLRAVRLGCDDRTQSDGAATDHQRRITGPQAGLLDVHLPDVQRFGEGGVVQRQPVGHLAHPVGIHDDLLTEGAVIAVGVADDGRDSGRGIGGQADSGHSVADGEIIHAGSDLGDDTGVLVAEYDRAGGIEGGQRISRGDGHVGESAGVLRHRQIAAADPARGHRDPDLPGPERGRIGDVGHRETPLEELCCAHDQAPVAAVP